MLTMWALARLPKEEPPAAPAHPLDPLSADELVRAVEVARSGRQLGERVRFVTVELHEPDKAALAAWRDGGDPPPREAFLVIYDQAADLGAEGVVGLDSEERTGFDRFAI